jgi:hypothetical protein
LCSFSPIFNVDVMDWIIIVAIFLVVVITAAIIALPSIIKAKINKALLAQRNFSGMVERVNVALFKGEVTLHNLAVHKPSTSADNLLVELHVPMITCAFKWRSLLRKQPDLNIEVIQPNVDIKIHSEPKPEEEIPGEPKVISLRAPLISMMPFSVNARISDGTVKFLRTGEFDFEMVVNDLDILIDQFSNREIAQPCAIAVTASLLDGNAQIKSTLHPLADALRLDADLKIRSVNMVLLNDVFRKFAKIDLSHGTLEVYSEITIKDNMFNGYITPVLKDLDFSGAEDRNDTFFRRVWEKIVAAGVKLLQNNKEDQLASRIPISGRLDDPKINMAAVIGGILKNAFIKPLRPSLENVFDIPGFINVARKKSRSFFQKLFGTPHQSSVS